MRVDYFEKCRLDLVERPSDYALRILEAMADLGGHVPSKNQLYMHIKEKYGGMPKKTFFKYFTMLEKCGFIQCSYPSDEKRRKLGVECRLTDSLIKISIEKIKEIKREISLLPSPEDCEKEPFLSTIKLIALANTELVSIYDKIAEASLQEKGEEVYILLLYMLKDSMTSLKDIFDRLLFTLPKIDECRRLNIAYFLMRLSFSINEILCGFKDGKERKACIEFEKDRFETFKEKTYKRKLSECKQKEGEQKIPTS